MKVPRTKKMEKLNLIPILDAVFIFIFFLLMSAQFVDIHEIGTDAPAVSTINPEKNDKKPLNLTLDIYKNRVIVKTGLDEKIYKTHTIQEGYLKSLRKTILDLKVKNMEENSIIFRPKNNVSYKELIKMMDTVRELAPEESEIAVKTAKGGQKKTRKLFDQIIFETII